MTAKTRQQLLALAALLVVLVVAWWRSGGAENAAVPAGGAAASVSGTAGTRTAEGAQVPVSDVRLEALQHPAAQGSEPTRNLFRFRARTPPPDRAPAPREQPAPAPAAAPPVPTGPPPPPPIPLRLIGMLNAPTQAGRVAILSDGRGNVFNGREGDIIEGRYRLLKIGTDSAELAYTDGRGRQVIRLAGQ